MNILEEVKAHIARCKTEDCCTCCGKTPIGGFKDELSVKEFGISGMCQECQDSIFTPISEEEAKRRLKCQDSD